MSTASEIRGMTKDLKGLYESERIKKLNDVRMSKAERIKDEIRMISTKDTEARRLEKHEESLLRRLKETHALQQETLQ
jgi:hypothetical protein